MDYEKKYKETLERAKSIKDSIIASHNKESASYYTGFINNIFPELNENEDERIRKLLVWQVHRNIEDETNDLAQSVYDGIKGHDPDIEESIEDWKKCLAYLEKQKEQKPSTPEDIAAAYQMGLAKGRNEQRSAEWSDEDKHRLEQAINALCRNGYYVLVDWLKLLPEKFNTQPKQEWSEEDEDMLERVIGSVANDELLTDEAYHNRLNWLKELPYRFNLPSVFKWTEKDKYNIESTIRNLEHQLKSITTPEVKKEIAERIDWLRHLLP